MSLSTRSPLIYIAGSGFFVGLDQTCKYLSLHAWNEPNLINHWLGWRPFLNPGIAFSLPLPNWLIISLSVPIISLLFSLFLKHWRLAHISVSHPVSSLYLWAIALLCGGALSNLFDRIVYHHTVDYIMIFTSIFNIADLLILLGGVLYYANFSKRDSPRKPF